MFGVKLEHDVNWGMKIIVFWNMMKCWLVACYQLSENFVVSVFKVVLRRTCCRENWLNYSHKSVHWKHFARRQAEKGSPIFETPSAGVYPFYFSILQPVLGSSSSYSKKVLVSVS